LADSKESAFLFDIGLILECNSAQTRQMNGQGEFFVGLKGKA
jgi:hypothetical protein